MSITGLYSKLGPGILYAAAAVGVSHLVQSTRAGAEFGFQLLWVILLANLIKYPFFKIGPQYTALTGKSLLSGYLKIGRWSLIIIILMTLATMFIVQSAITVVSAGLLNQFIGLDINVKMTACLILITCVIILIIGRYHLLDQFIKIIIILLTITTIITIGFSLFGHFTIQTAVVDFSFNNKDHLFFFMALVGWMPAPMDIPIWHGLWSMAKNRDQQFKTTVSDAMLDFNIGYITTAILACAFLALGSIVLYRSGVSLESTATGFAAQLVGMYTKALGQWSYPFISIAAFTTMFSTALTCLDAFSRLMREAMYLILQKDGATESSWYNFWLFVTAIGSLAIIFFFLKNMKDLVDLATAISFLIAPVYAILNYRVIISDEIPSIHKPQGFMKILSYFGMAFFIGFTVYYLSTLIN